MKKTEHFFASSNGTDNVRYVVWECDEPKAILQISHGMSEYIDRYDAFAEFLCERGFVVCGEDHIGHGKNAPLLGYLADRNGDRCLVEDTRLLYGIIEEQYPSLPHAVMGHSMGSFIVRAFLSEYGDLPRCAVIMGTTGAKMPYSAAIFLAKVISLFKGKKAQSQLLYNLSLGSYNKAFENEGNTGCEWLSRDKDVALAYSADPLCGFGFTLKGYGDLFALLRSISSKKWYSSFPKALPTLLVSGACDPVGENGKGVKLVYDSLVAAGCEKVTLRLFDGCRHELLNETNRAEVCEYIYDYLNKELSL